MGNNFLNILIALVWLINGLFCKILNLVPRHQEIVAKILNLNESTARLFIILIGISEVLMAIWITTRIKHRFNAIVQIIIIATMNLLEFIFAPDLLLCGRLNAVFALALIVVIYYNAFVLNSKKQ